MDQERTETGAPSPAQGRPSLSFAGLSPVIHVRLPRDLYARLVTSEENYSTIVRRALWAYIDDPSQTSGRRRDLGILLGRVPEPTSFQGGQLQPLTPPGTDRVGIADHVVIRQLHDEF